MRRFTAFWVRKKAISITVHFSWTIHQISSQNGKLPIIVLVKNFHPTSRRQPDKQTWQVDWKNYVKWDLHSQQAYQFSECIPGVLNWLKSTLKSVSWRLIPRANKLGVSNCPVRCKRAVRSNIVWVLAFAFLLFPGRKESSALVTDIIRWHQNYV